MKASPCGYDVSCTHSTTLPFIHRSLIHSCRHSRSWLAVVGTCGSLLTPPHRERHDNSPQSKQHSHMVAHRSSNSRTALCSRSLHLLCWSLLPQGALASTACSWRLGAFKAARSGRRIAGRLCACARLRPLAPRLWRLACRAASALWGGAIQRWQPLCSPALVLSSLLQARTPPPVGAKDSVPDGKHIGVVALELFVVDVMVIGACKEGGRWSCQ